MIAISLLLCTRNRGASLDRTLGSITRAARRFAAIEAVVVDNGSSDDTPRRLAEWHRVQAFPVTLVHEPRAGLARARNAGLARTRGAIVAMTDDDCLLDPGFFEQLAARFALVPAPVVIGGRILLGHPDDLPVTIKLEDHAMIARRDDYPGGFVMGANLAFTRDVVDRIGGFDERFGAGARFRAAEDTDFLFRATGAGIAVRYDPHVVVTHHHGRQTPAALRRLLAGYAFGDGAVYAKHVRHDARIVRAIRVDLDNMTADLGTRERVFASIRFFHVFRCRHIVHGFIIYTLAASWAAVARAARKRKKVRPNSHTFEETSDPGGHVEI